MTGKKAGMGKEITTAIFLGTGLSAGCGFRVFLPMLIAGIVYCLACNHGYSNCDVVVSSVKKTHYETET